MASTDKQKRAGGNGSKNPQPQPEPQTRRFELKLRQHLPLGVSFQKSRDGMCVVKKTSNASKLQVGDVIVSMNGIDLASIKGGVRGWGQLFNVSVGSARTLVVQRAVDGTSALGHKESSPATGGDNELGSGSAGGDGVNPQGNGNVHDDELTELGATAQQLSLRSDGCNIQPEVNDAKSSKNGEGSETKNPGPSDAKPPKSRSHPRPGTTSTPQNEQGRNRTPRKHTPQSLTKGFSKIKLHQQQQEEQQQQTPKKSMHQKSSNNRRRNGMRNKDKNPHDDKDVCVEEERSQPNSINPEANVEKTVPSGDVSGRSKLQLQQQPSPAPEGKSRTRGRPRIRTPKSKQTPKAPEVPSVPMQKKEDHNGNNSSESPIPRQHQQQQVRADKSSENKGIDGKVKQTANSDRKHPESRLRQKSQAGALPQTKSRNERSQNRRRTPTKSKTIHQTTSDTVPPASNKDNPTPEAAAANSYTMHQKDRANRQPPAMKEKAIKPQEEDCNGSSPHASSTDDAAREDIAINQLDHGSSSEKPDDTTMIAPAATIPLTDSSSTTPEEAEKAPAPTTPHDEIDDCVEEDRSKPNLNDPKANVEKKEEQMASSSDKATQHDKDQTTNQQPPEMKEKVNKSREDDCDASSPHTSDTNDAAREDIAIGRLDHGSSDKPDDTTTIAPGDITDQENDNGHDDELVEDNDATQQLSLRSDDCNIQPGVDDVKSSNNQEGTKAKKPAPSDAKLPKSRSHPSPRATSPTPETKQGRNRTPRKHNPRSLTKGFSKIKLHQQQQQEQQQQQQAPKGSMQQKTPNNRRRNEVRKKDSSSHDDENVCKEEERGQPNSIDPKANVENISEGNEQSKLHVQPKETPSSQTKPQARQTRARTRTPNSKQASMQPKREHNSIRLPKASPPRPQQQQQVQGDKSSKNQSTDGKVRQTVKPDRKASESKLRQKSQAGPSPQTKSRNERTRNRRRTSTDSNVPHSTGSSSTRKSTNANARVPPASNKDSHPAEAAGNSDPMQQEDGANQQPHMMKEKENKLQEDGCNGSVSQASGTDDAAREDIGIGQLGHGNSDKPDGTSTIAPAATIPLTNSSSTTLEDAGKPPPLTFDHIDIDFAELVEEINEEFHTENGDDPFLQRIGNFAASLAARSDICQRQLFAQMGNEESEKYADDVSDVEAGPQQQADEKSDEQGEVMATATATDSSSMVAPVNKEGGQVNSSNQKATEEVAPQSKADVQPQVTLSPR